MGRTVLYFVGKPNKTSHGSGVDELETPRSRAPGWTVDGGLWSSILHEFHLNCLLAIQVGTEG